MSLRCLHVRLSTVNRSDVGRSRPILGHVSQLLYSLERRRVLPKLVESDDRWEMNAYTGWNLIAMNNEYKYNGIGR